MSKPIRSTKRQRDKLAQCNAGVGIIIYHEGNGTICEFEFYIDRQGQLRPITNSLHAPPLRLEIIDEEEGIKVIEIASRFAGASPDGGPDIEDIIDAMHDFYEAQHACLAASPSNDDEVEICPTCPHWNGNTCTGDGLPCPDGLGPIPGEVLAV